MLTRRTDAPSNNPSHHYRSGANRNVPYQNASGKPLIHRGLFADQRTSGLWAGELAYRVFVLAPVNTVLLDEIAFRGVLHGLGAAQPTLRLGDGGLRKRFRPLLGERDVTSSSQQHGSARQEAMLQRRRLRPDRFTCRSR